MPWPAWLVAGTKAVAAKLGYSSTKLFLFHVGAAAVSTAASAIHSRNASERAQRNAEEATGFAVRDTDSGAILPIGIGRAAIPGYRAIPGFTEASIVAAGNAILGAQFDIAGALADASERVFYGDGTQSMGAMFRAGRGKENQYLLMQHVLFDPVRIIDVWLRDATIKPSGEIRTSNGRNRIDSEDSVAGRAIAEFSFNGAALASATAFTGRRTSNSSSRPLSHVNLWLKKEPKDPKFFGQVPVGLYFGEFGKNRAITSTTTLADEETYGNTPQRFMIQLLTGGVADKGVGPLIPDSEIGIRSAFVTEQIARRIVEGPGTDETQRYIDIDRDGTPDAPVPNVPFESGVPYSTIFRRLGIARNKAGLTDQPLAFGDLSDIVMRRHECNGFIKPIGTYVELLKQVLENFPGLKFYASLEGTYNWSFPDTNRTESQLAVGTINERVLRAPPTPIPSNPVNQVVVRFNNIEKNYAQDELTYPAEGSAADRALLAEDGGERRKVTVDLSLVNNKQDATDRANTILLLSRRTDWEVLATLDALRYEQGDVIELSHPDSQLNVWARVEEADFARDGGMRLIVKRFAVNDFKYTPEQPDVIEVSAPIARPLPAPTITLERDRKKLIIKWTATNSALDDIVLWNVEVQLNGGTYTSHAIVEEEPVSQEEGVNTYSLDYPLPETGSTIRVRINGITTTGRRGPFGESDVFTFNGESLGLIALYLIIERTGMVPTKASIPEGIIIDPGPDGEGLSNAGNWVQQVPDTYNRASERIFVITTIKARRGVPIPRADWVGPREVDIDDSVARLHIGAGAPDDAVGRDGDIYVQGNGKVYEKKNGRWELDSGIDLTGDPGNKIYSGVVDADRLTPTLADLRENDSSLNLSDLRVGDIFIGQDDTGATPVRRDGRWWRWNGTAWIIQGDLTGPRGESLTISSRQTQGDGSIRVEFSDGTFITIPAGRAGTPGTDGTDGTNGVGIARVNRNNTTGIVTVTYTDGTTDTFLINDGQDGAGFEFVYTRRNSITALPRPSSSRTTDESVPSGYTDDPRGVTSTLRYEYVSVRHGPTGNWSTWSVPSLFAVFSVDGEDGTSVTIVSATTQANGSIRIVFSDGTFITVPAGQDGEDGTDGRGVSSITRSSSTGFVTVTYTDGSTQQFLINDGQDGAGFEFGFRRTTGARPGRPTSSRTTDESLPSGYTDDPQGTTSTFRVEWVIVRTGSTGNWSTWSVPAEYSNYAEDGEDGVDAVTAVHAGLVSFHRASSDDAWVPNTAQESTVWYYQGTTLIARVTRLINVPNSNGNMSQRRSSASPSSGYTGFRTEEDINGSLIVSQEYQGVRAYHSAIAVTDGDPGEDATSPIVPSPGLVLFATTTGSGQNRTVVFRDLGTGRTQNVRVGFSTYNLQSSPVMRIQSGRTGNLGTASLSGRRSQGAAIHQWTLTLGDVDVDITIIER